jgi:hypothetical protein
MWRARTLPVVGLALALAACAGGAAGPAADRPAADAARAYLDALAADDPRGAYDLLAADVRRDLRFPAFAAAWKAHRAERAAQRDALARALRADAAADERARVRFADGATTTLRRERGAWRLDAGLLAGRHAPAPAAALERFAAALTARSWLELLPVLTTRRREALAAQVDGFVASLGKQMADPRRRIDRLADDRAELAWDDGELRYKVVLLLDDGEWRVDDVVIVPMPTPPAP